MDNERFGQDNITSHQTDEKQVSDKDKEVKSQAKGNTASDDTMTANKTDLNNDKSDLSVDEMLFNDMQRRNGYREFEKKKQKDRSKFSSGLLLGMFAGIIFTITFLLLVFGFVYNAGYLHLNSKGQIYVQDTKTDDDNGIGEKVSSKLNTLSSLLTKFYFEDIDENEAAENIYKAYLDSFNDPYTVYYTAEEYKLIEESTSGTFYGIGALCRKMDDGSIELSEVYEDSPAAKAGLVQGDCITTVDGTSILDVDLNTAIGLIRGEEGTKVVLGIKRDSGLVNITVERGEVKEKTVEYKMLDNDIGYIRIIQFEAVTTQQFKDALKELTNEDMKGLIIDIRDNPGGLLQTVVNVLDEVLPKGLLVYTEDKTGKKTEYRAKDNDELEVPLAVLVNENSASASEIFAGAIQDYKKGSIIGTKTFGKGIVQTIKSLTDGSAIKFTIAKYYTPLGQDIHGKGVTPDTIVQNPESSNIDYQLNTGISYIKSEIKKNEAEQSTKTAQ